MRDYRELVTLPGAWWVIIGAFPGRLSFSMSGLAIFFHVQKATGSLAAAGSAVGAYTLVSSLTAAARGHLVDRLGQSIPLLIFVPSYATATIVMAFFGNKAGLAIPLAALCGLTAPPFNISVRPLWLDIAGQGRVRTAYALDTVLMNIAMLLGPVAATFVALSFSSGAALITVSALMIAGGSIIGFSPVSRNWVPEKKDPNEVSLFRSKAIRLMAVDGLFMGLGVGLLTVSIPAAATLAGRAEIAGTLLAMNAFGAILGGLFAGSRLKHVDPLQGLIVTGSLGFVFAAPLAFLDPGIAMALALLAGGFAQGPAVVFYFELVDRVRPRGTASSALATLWTIEGSATAAGSAAAGWVAEHLSVSAGLGAAATFFIASPIIMAIGARGVLAGTAQTLEAEEPATPRTL